MNKELIVISAIWCPSCLILKKHLKKLMAEYKNLNVTSLDYDLNDEEVKKYKVGEVLPIIISYPNSPQEKRLVGEKSYEEIVEFLKESNLI